MAQRFEAVLARPLWLVLIVALGLGFPVIAVGEAAANDARTRSGQAETAATSLATQRAATAIADRLKIVKSQVAVMTQPSTSGKAPPLVSALQAGDSLSLQTQLAALRALIEPELPPSAFGADFYILDPGNLTLAVDPFIRTSIGVDRSGRPYAGGAAQAAAVTVTPVFRAVIDPTLARNPTNALNAGVVGRMVEPGSLRPLGSLVVLVSARVVSDPIQALRPAAEEVYVVDETGRLIVRATRQFSSDTATFMDLSAQPVVAAALRGPLAGVPFDDPFGAGIRLTTAAAVSDLGWQVVAVARTSVAGIELESTLAGQRVVRALLVLLLLAGTYVLARTVRRTIRQRRELATANVTIAQSNEAKSRFLTNMSHELRTPLNAIIGFSDVLGQKMFGDLNPKQDEYIADIGTSGRHLLDLVNQILDLSKVEAGRMDLELSTFSPGETIRASLAFVRERAAAHRIEIAAAVPADLPSVTADERKIRQVLLNLLSNAVKFTPDGGSIVVTARTASGDLVISVQDSGIGIAPEDQPAVFEEFRQFGRAGERSREGTGLGLTLAKRFVELHGGRIWIESEVGTGTTFTFAIPMDRAASAIT